MFKFFFTTCLGFLLFSNSPQQMAVLEEVAHRRIPRSSATRWNLKVESCKQFLSCVVHLLNVVLY